MGPGKALIRVSSSQLVNRNVIYGVESRRKTVCTLKLSFLDSGDAMFLTESGQRFVLAQANVVCK